MSTRAEIDEVLRQKQQGVRKMTPLVAEQQPERDRVELPKPAMVVRERWSRSSRQEWMEQRVIEIALEEGKSMEEIEEILAEMKRYSLGMITKEEKQKRLEMLEECRLMIDQWDEEDESKRQHEETLVAGDLNDIVKLSRESLKRINLIQVPEETDSFLIPLMVASEKYGPHGHTCDGENKGSLNLRVEQYFERGKDETEEMYGFDTTERKNEYQHGGDKPLETDISNSTYQLLDQTSKRRKKVTKKKKRWKNLFPDIEEQLEEILSCEMSDNSEILGIHMENTTKRQRQCLLMLWKGVSCQWLHTRQRSNRKWLLLFQKKKRKRKRMTYIAEKNYGSYDMSKHWKETARDMLRNMAGELQYHVLKDAAENRGKNRSVEMKIHNSPSLGRRLLLLNITKKKKESTRLEQHEKKCIKSNKKGKYCGPMKQRTIEYEMKRNMLELEQMSLIQKHERVLRKLEKWQKHKFKQKNQWEWIKQGSVLNKSRKLLTAFMRKRAKSRKFLSGNKTLFFRNIKLVLPSFRMNFRVWCKRNHFGRVCLKSRNWLKLSDLEKMGSEQWLAACPRGRVKWKCKRCLRRKFLSPETALEVKFFLAWKKRKKKQMTYPRTCYSNALTLENHRLSSHVLLTIIVISKMRKSEEDKLTRRSKANMRIRLKCSEKWGSQHELKVWDPGLVCSKKNQWLHMVDMYSVPGLLLAKRKKFETVKSRELNNNSLLLMKRSGESHDLGYECLFPGTATISSFRKCFVSRGMKVGHDLTLLRVYKRNHSGQESGGMYGLVWMTNYVVVLVEWFKTKKEAAAPSDETLEARKILAASLNLNKMEIGDVNFGFHSREKWQSKDENISAPLTRVWEPGGVAVTQIDTENEHQSRSKGPPEMTFKLLKQCCGGCWSYWWSYSLLRCNEKECDLRFMFLLWGKRRQQLQNMLIQEEELSQGVGFCLKLLEGIEAILETTIEGIKAYFTQIGCHFRALDCYCRVHSGQRGNESLQKALWVGYFTHVLVINSKQQDTATYLAIPLVQVWDLQDEKCSWYWKDVTTKSQFASTLRTRLNSKGEVMISVGIG